MTMKFLVNSSLVETEAWAMVPALDYIRRGLGLTGTKEGCREGDCGACAVILGERPERLGTELGAATYRALPSCLLALGELEGRHLLTIEGLAAAGQTPVMRALSEANGSQCGFCSPGFVMSLTAYLINGAEGEGRLSVEGAYTAVEGNLCRCTGYGAIKRAAASLVEEFAKLPLEPLARLEALVAAGVIPAACSAFARGGESPSGALANQASGALANQARAIGQARGAFPLAGGTDFYVRNTDPEPAAFPSFLLLDRKPSFKRVELRPQEAAPKAGAGAALEIGAALSWREFFSNPLIRELVPGIEGFEYLLASPLIRERATIGGNIANASPVGDLTAMLIALGARVRVEGEGSPREMPLEKLFLAYKKLDLAPPARGRAGEIITTLILPASRPFARFNFEKASKRERLDIAAVNSAASFEVEEAAGSLRLRAARISAGGVAPVPLLLEKASAFLGGRIMDPATALEAARIAAAEVSPIGDVRGSADYRRRVLERLVLAHFVVLFPGCGVEEALA